MNVVRNYIVSPLSLTLVLTAVMFCVSASSVLGAPITFGGYVFNVTESPINGTNVTIEVWQDTPTWGINSSYSNISDINGKWSVTFDDGVLNGRSVKFVVRHFTGPDSVDFRGGILPPFPWQELSPQNPFSPINISNITFYLKEAATINITAINSSNENIGFSYAVVDTKIGFPIESDWTNIYTEKIVHVPADRNYSIQVIPQQAMPVFYELNNLSAYSTPKRVNIIFNTTSSLIRVSGHINLSNGTGSFDTLEIVNFLLEPGNMIFGSNPIPYNMSSWDCPTGPTSCKTDIFYATNGTYNISLEGTTMDAKVMMFAIAKVGNEYWGGFRNLSPSIGQTVNNFNFTLYRLLGPLSNITVTGGQGQQKAIPVTKSLFAFVNSSGDVLTSIQPFVSVELDYSDLTQGGSPGPQFSWMVNLDVNSQGRFSVPLLNYSVKKLEAFVSGDYAPLKKSLKVSDLNYENYNQVNITLKSMDFGEIEGKGAISGIQIKMTKSSPLCDVPVQPTSCNIGGADFMDEGSFKPLNAVISGGKISFRMQQGSIVVHYVNVDMIASGPPDIMFEAQSNDSASGSSLQQAWTFGSSGPDIYDSLIIGIPYNESTVDETKNQSVLIETLYDETLINRIWNASDNQNGLNTSQFPDYASFDQRWFNTSAGGMLCQDISNFDINVQGCYTNTTTNIHWLVLPHFSGLGPQVRSIAVLGTISSDKTIYSCYPSCSATINVSVNNSGIIGTTNISINNTDISGHVTYGIEWWNSTAAAWQVATNENKSWILNYNLSLGTNIFRINISMSTPLSTKWNFSIDLGGTLYTLDPYLDAIELTSPNDNYLVNDSTETFSFVLYSTNSTTQTCSLVINGTTYATNTSVTNGSSTTMTPSSLLGNGGYSWYISCNVTGNSTTRTITVNDISAPTLTINSPSNPQTESTFLLNITAEWDADTCYFNITYGENASSSINNQSRVAGTLSSAVGTVKYCTYLASFINANYTLKIEINDSQNNLNTTTFGFNVSDTSSPLISGFNYSANVTSISSSSATITFVANEYINATISYGTATTLGSAVTDTTFDSKTQSVSLSGLSASTLYHFNITACDYAGNCVTNGTFNFTTSAAPTTPSSSSGGSSSGGGGGATVPTTTNIIAKISRVWATISTGAETTMPVNNDKIAVQEISFATKNTYSNVEVTVSSISKPDDLESATGVVYQYLDIDTTNLPDEGISNAKIEFSIPLSWFTENKAKRGTVTLYRYTDKWTALITTERSSDTTTVYYEATTPGFSYFAISAEKEEEVVEAPSEETPVEEEVPEEAPSEEPSQEITTQPEPEEKPKKSKAWIVWLILGVLLIGTLVYMIFLRGKQPVQK
jgi:PGF-pre-PGF domain-containing protein